MRWLTRILATAALLAGAHAFSAAPLLADDAGEALFLRGEGAEVILAGGRFRRPADEFACAGCHGADGRGRREGGTVFPPILWSALSDSARPGGAYTAAALARALESGVAPDGRVLASAMPRYALADRAMAGALAGYLAVLDSRQRRGVTADRIAVSPPEDPSAARGFATAIMAENAAGGAWGRLFDIAPPDASLLTAAEAAAALAPAMDRAVANAAAAAVRAAGHGTIAAVGDAARMTPALAAAGLAVSPDAEARIALSAGGAILALPGGRLVTIAPAMPPGAERDAEALGGLIGREVGRAALACGRGVTRACLLETLGLADLAGLYLARTGE